MFCGKYFKYIVVSLFVCLILIVANLIFFNKLVFDLMHILPQQIIRVLITILDTSSDPRCLAVACYDLSQFIQSHPVGRGIVNDLKAKERVMKLLNHENTEVRKNSLLCVQRLFLGTKYASFMQS